MPTARARCYESFVKWLALVIAVVALTATLFLLSTDGGATVLGLPLACVGSWEIPCWITAGGSGVLVVGGGTGVVAIGIAGAGLLFATGQIAIGLIAFGQLALGGVAFLGQVATGLVGAAQGGLGWLTVVQGGNNVEGRAFLKQLDADLAETLRPW